MPSLPSKATIDGIVSELTDGIVSKLTTLPTITEQPTTPRPPDSRPPLPGNTDARRLAPEVGPRLVYPLSVGL